MSALRTRNIDESILMKHTASIHVANKWSLIERKVSNLLLKNAYQELDKKESFLMSIKDIQGKLGWEKNKNHEYLKEVLRNLVSTKIEWNIFGKDKRNSWNVSTFLSSASLNEEPGYCKYSFSPELKKLLRSPNIYARLNLAVQREFCSKYSVILWEFLVEALCSSKSSIKAETDWITLDNYRRLLGVNIAQYKEFKIFHNHLIKIPLKEINSISDIEVTYTLEKSSRKYSAIKFFVVRNKNFKEKLTLGDINRPIDHEGNDLIGNIFEDMVLNFKLTEKQAKMMLASYKPENIKEALKQVARYVHKNLVKDIPSYTILAIKSFDSDLNKKLLVGRPSERKNNDDVVNRLKDLGFIKEDVEQMINVYGVKRIERNLNYIRDNKNYNIRSKKAYVKDAIFKNYANENIEKEQESAEIEIDHNLSCLSEEGVDLLEGAISYIKQTLGDKVYNSWFSKMHLENFQDNIEISFPTEFISKWNMQQYEDILFSAFKLSPVTHTITCKTR